MMRESIHSYAIPVPRSLLCDFGIGFITRAAADNTRAALLRHGAPGPLHTLRSDVEIVFYREARSSE